MRTHFFHMAFSIWIFVTCQTQTGNQYLSIFVCLTTESSVRFYIRNLKGTRSGYRDSLWNILRHYSIPSQLVHLIKSFYHNIRCLVGHNNIFTMLKPGSDQDVWRLHYCSSWSSIGSCERQQKTLKEGSARAFSQLYRIWTSRVTLCCCLTYTFITKKRPTGCKQTDNRLAYV